MSFACNQVGCRRLSIYQCSCMNSFKFCESHILQHQRKTRCNVAFIEDELFSAQERIQEIKYILKDNKKKLIAISNELILHIQSILQEGLALIKQNEGIINSLVEFVDVQQANSIIKKLFPKQENKEQALNSIRNLLNIHNYQSMSKEAIFEDLNLEEQKNYLLEKNFEEFEGLMDKNNYFIEFMKITDDNNYAFTCDYYSDCMIKLDRVLSILYTAQNAYSANSSYSDSIF